MLPQYLHERHTSDLHFWTQLTSSSLLLYKFINVFIEPKNGSKTIFLYYNTIPKTFGESVNSIIFFSDILSARSSSRFTKPALEVSLGHVAMNCWVLSMATGAWFCPHHLMFDVSTGLFCLISTDIPSVSISTPMIPIHIYNAFKYTYFAATSSFQVHHINTRSFTNSPGTYCSPPQVKIKHVKRAYVGTGIDDGKYVI